MTGLPGFQDIVRGNPDVPFSQLTFPDPSHLIGNWPNKGAIIHYHWAKLYLQSYVLRGLPETGAVIPDHFLENASSAVQAAVAIISLLLEDKDAQVAIGFVAHHVHGMVAFAAMFLLKIATKHREQLFVDVARFQRLIAALAAHFKTIDVGKDHLLHRMAEGLEKMSETLGGPARPRQRKHTARLSQEDIKPPAESINPSQTLANGANHAGEYGSMENAFDFGDPALGLGMPFFDFEGTTLNGSSMWDF